MVRPRYRSKLSCAASHKRILCFALLASLLANRVASCSCEDSSHGSVSNYSARRLANFVSYSVLSAHGGGWSPPGRTIPQGLDIRYYPPSNSYANYADLSDITGSASGSCITTGSSTTRYAPSGDGLVSCASWE